MTSPDISAPDSQGRWAVLILVAALSVPPFELGHPVCPSGFWLAQRMDKRDKFGIIVKRRWHYACLTVVPKVVYK